MHLSRPRVLFNRPDPDLHGGAATALPLLACELRKHVSLQNFAYGRKKDIETLLTKFIGRSLDLVALRSKISEFKPDLIHHNTAFDAMAIIRDSPLLWLARRYDVPTLMVMHGSLDSSFGKMNPILSWLRQSSLKNMARLGVLSAKEKEKFVETWPDLERRVCIVKNIIHPAFFNSRPLSGQIGPVLMVSRLVKEKGIFDLLEAIPLILEKSPSTKFLFVGSGEDEADFDERIHAYQLEAAVKRIPHQDHLKMANIYASALMLIFPTHFAEGMPMVVAEAMASGLPIITSQTRFSLSYMLEGRHCLYIDRKKPKSIADQAIILLHDPQLRAYMAEQNSYLARSFRNDIVSGEFVNLYNEILTFR